QCPAYVVTSVGPGEGKTTLSANIAIAMASIGQRVLLIDADLRRARLHSLFDLKNRPGLGELLTSTQALDQLDLDSHITRTHVPDLHVLTHGLTQVDTPATLFFSDRVKELVTALRRRYDFILMDTAPVMPFPDARLLGQRADAIVLVVRSGITTREGAMNACQLFQEDGIPVLG